MYDIIGDKEKEMLKYINLEKYKTENTEKLLKFKELLLFYNKKFNLTSITEDKEFEVKHLEDSIKNEKYFPLNSNVVEVGSGGGFPSIPLMCIRDDLTFTLVESVGKKCEFLKTAIRELNLKAEVLNKRAEDVGKDKNLRESFDVSTARAVARLNSLSEYCIPLIKKGGLFIAYKGFDKEEIKESENAIKILGGKLIESENYKLSYDLGERNVYIIKKIENTPIKYPRGNGKERSKPL